jgi:uncharacterized protein (TIGR00290 family)
VTAEAEAEAKKVLFCWSGGKDSALALRALQQRADVRVTGLLTTVTDGYDRISMHGVRRSLLLRQAEQIGLPLQEVRIPPQCVNPIYEARMKEAMLRHKESGTCGVAFGDIFLEDLREYRERNLALVDMKAMFPIWKRDTRELAREFCELGFRAVAVCIDPRKLPREFAGRELDESFFRDLPEGVDPCGENGEFHTFVYGGPIFSQGIEVERGETVERDGFYFCDLKEKTT